MARQGEARDAVEMTRVSCQDGSAGFLEALSVLDVNPRNMDGMGGA